MIEIHFIGILFHGKLLQVCAEVGEESLFAIGRVRVPYKFHDVPLADPFVSIDVYKIKDEVEQRLIIKQAKGRDSLNELFEKYF